MIKVHIPTVQYGYVEIEGETIDEVEGLYDSAQAFIGILTPDTATPIDEHPPVDKPSAATCEFCSSELTSDQWGNTYCNNNSCGPQCETCGSPMNLKNGTSQKGKPYSVFKCSEDECKGSTWASDYRDSL